MPLSNNIALPLARAIMLCTLVVLPWLHGAELFWEQLFVAAGLFTALVVMLWDKHALARLPSGSLLITGLFGIWLLHTVLYLVPLPSSLIAWISPNTYQWLSSVEVADYGYLSLYRQASVIELFKFSGLVAIFLLVGRLFTTRRQLRWFSAVVVASGALTAVYSLLNFTSGGAFELVSAIPPWNLSWHEGIRGTFSYKNQYAMYMVICIALCAGLLTDELIKRRQRTALVTPVTCGLSLLLLILLATLMNTSSRGALVSLLVGCAVAAAFFISRNRYLAGYMMQPKVLGSMAAAAVLLITLFMQSSIYERFTDEKMQDNGRTLLRNTVIQVIEDYPVFGTGPGTYPFVQHNYKPLELGNTQMSKRAHNDYLETLATQGALGFALLMIPLGLLLIRLFRYSLHGNTTGLLIGCQVATVAYLVQALFDVNIGVYLLPVHLLIVLSIGWVLTTRFTRDKPAL